MSESMPYADIVILALVAGFILLRLRSILGTKQGHDNPDFFRKELQQRREMQEPIIQLGEKINRLKQKEEADKDLQAIEDASVKDALALIKAKDPSFSISQFMSGARYAFEMVFDAFAKGDKETLKMLLNDELYAHFTSEVEKRTSSEQKEETTLVSAQAKTITKATLVNNTAKISVRFVSEQIVLVRDASGTILEGDASQGHEAEDEWTFERDVTSKNPNWKIIDT